MMRNSVIAVLLAFAGMYAIDSAKADDAKNASQPALAVPASEPAAAAAPATPPPASDPAQQATLPATTSEPLAQTAEPANPTPQPASPEQIREARRAVTDASFKVGRTHMTYLDDSTPENREAYRIARAELRKAQEVYDIMRGVEPWRSSKEKKESAAKGPIKPSEIDDALTSVEVIDDRTLVLSIILKDQETSREQTWSFTYQVDDSGTATFQQTETQRPANNPDVPK